MENGEKKQSVEEKILIRMRKCGRILLHEFAQGNKEAALDFLSEDEKKVLSVLLKKCLNEWKSVEK